jgi:uncharacterized coiled-coil protein SlyX
MSSINISDVLGQGANGRPKHDSVLDIEDSSDREQATNRNDNEDLIGLIQSLRRELRVAFTSISETNEMVSKQQVNIATMSNSMNQLTKTVDTMANDVQVLTNSLNVAIRNQSQDTPRTANNTRQVTSTIPAAVIRGIWYDNRTDVFPVELAYLKRLCDATYTRIDPDSKSRLGASLANCISGAEDNVNIHKSILTTICITTTYNNAEMLRVLMEIIEQLGTNIAFLLPSSLSTLLNRVEVLLDTGAVLKDNYDAAKMVRYKQGYDVISTKAITDTRVIKAVRRMVDSKLTRSGGMAIYNTLSTNSIAPDGKITPAPTSSTRALFTEHESTTTPPKEEAAETSADESFTIDDILSPVKR